MAQMQVHKDVEELINLFLSEDYDPSASICTTQRSRTASGSTNFQFESEVDEEEFLHDHHLHHVVHDEYFYKRCGRTLAKMGDEFFVHKEGPHPADSLKDVLERAAVKSSDKQEQEKAFQRFKEVMANSVSDTMVKDTYQKLGAFLLALNGFSNLNAGAKQLVRVFSQRFCTEEVDTKLQEIGGLEKLLERELD